MLAMHRSSRRRCRIRNLERTFDKKPNVTDLLNNSIDLSITVPRGNEANARALKLHTCAALGDLDQKSTEFHSRSERLTITRVCKRGIALYPAKSLAHAFGLRKVQLQNLRAGLALLSFATIVLILSTPANAQQVRCDPSKVLTAATCAKCHANEVAVWKQTPHAMTFDQLSRDPRAKEICSNLGLRSVKRSETCVKCHFTQKTTNDRTKAVSGVSCESCHGAAADWLDTHYDYGGPDATKDSESAEHREARLAASTELGMRNTRDLYSIASSCFNCHTVPNESLVSVGGHQAGSQDFELVRWSQGKVRHNFLRDGQTNAVSTPERLRVMFVAGMVADLEFSTRAVAVATEKSNYGMTVAGRAASVATRLNQLQQKLSDQNLQLALNAFAQAELRTNNRESLEQIADQIKKAGHQFVAANDGSELAAVDASLPDPSSYK